MKSGHLNIGLDTTVKYLYNYWIEKYIMLDLEIQSVVMSYLSSGAMCACRSYTASFLTPPLAQRCEDG